MLNECLVVVSGEMARGGSMGVGEDASKVWGHTMSCGWSDGLFISVVGIGG